MEKKGLQNEAFIRKIKEDGSNALKPKNDIGVNVADKNNTSSGLISGKLIRPKYNQDELLKSIDTEISELLPRTRPTLPDTVLRSVYNEATQSINELTLEVEELENDVTTLSSRIESLNSTTQSLQRELDGVNLSKMATDNQLSISQESFSNTTIDLQTAIQNSTQEAIQRVSLTARNQALKQEVDSLREQLYGRAAQLQAGGESSGTLFTVRSSPIVLESAPPIRGTRDTNVRFLRSNILGDPKWVNGQNLTIFNASEETIQFSFNLLNKATWVKRPESFSLDSGEEKTITLEINTGNISSTFPEFGSKNRSATNKNYDGALQVIGAGAEKQETVEVQTRMRKTRS